MSDAEDPGQDPIRTVIVDDAVDLRNLLRMVLDRDPRFVVVGEAENGAVGVELVFETLPDLVVLDLAMPVMDGYEALRRIREEYQLFPVVVILSGFSSADTEDTARRLGAAGYLEKGFALADVADRLATSTYAARSVRAASGDVTG